ncbi:MAG: Poxvirus G6 [Bacteroidia bacterium]|nr:Poxvirus G6 [Bacteroidia bacterium]
MQKKYWFYLLGVIVLTVSVYALWNEKVKEVQRTDACWEGIIKKLSVNQSPDSLLHSEIIDFQQFVEQSLVIRAQMLKVAEEIKETPDDPISPKNLELLREGTVVAMDLREKLYFFAETYECAVDAEDSTLNEYNISPTLRLKAVMLSLSAALTLYDNYLMGALLFEGDDRLRRLVNDPDKGFSISANNLLEVSWSAHSISKQQRIQKGIDFFEKESNNLDNEYSDTYYEYLKLLITSSPSYNYFNKIGLEDMATGKFNLLGKITADVIAELRQDGMNSISKFFGNSVGLIESRKGKLFNNKEVAKSLRSILQPLDIILEKTPFRLTDKLIPGHFGHVAIWIGNKDDLISLDMWEHELLKPYHQEITHENGENIIEALRSGVQLSSLEDFMNVDDIAILRPVFDENTLFEDQQEALLLAIRQIGKDYDFNFDINTTEKIVCSELAYVCYPTIDWPTKATLGRHTISPDNVAKLCWTGAPLQLISFYHNGNQVGKDKQLELLKELMSL